MRKNYLGTINAQQSERFVTKLISVAHALRANKHNLSVIEVIKLHERVDMKHENITIAESRAEQSRAEQSQGCWLYGQSA